MKVATLRLWNCNNSSRLLDSCQVRCLISLNNKTQIILTCLDISLDSNSELWNKSLLIRVDMINFR